MQLEDYFNFLAPDDIRVKGTRVGIETILWDYLEKGRTVDQIVEDYPSVNREQVHATLTYYWRNRAQVDAYLQDIEADYEARYAEQMRNPSPAVQRLIRLIEERQLTGSAYEP